MKSSETSSSLNITVSETVTDDIAALLKDTTFGTPGKIRYRQIQIAERVQSADNIEFIQIRKRGRLLGTTGVIHRTTNSNGNSFKCLYVRYLSMWNPFRDRNTDQKRNNRKKTTGLRQELNTQIIRHFEKPMTERNDITVFYAFVESENRNSRDLCMSLGFNPCRTVSTFLFSRFAPSAQPNIRLATDADHQQICAALRSFYSDHAFYFEDKLFDSGVYFVLEHEGRIVGGLRAHEVNWQIVEIPGWKGVLMQKVLPYLPLTSRLFDPEDLNFLAFDYLWFDPPFRNQIFSLMEHAAAISGIQTGMIWCDTGSVLHDMLGNSGKLGMLHHINGSVQADVLMRFINQPEKIRVALLHRPVFVSALDMS